MNRRTAVAEGEALLELEAERERLLISGEAMPSGLRWSIIGSVLVHFGVAFAVLVAGSATSRPAKSTETVITTKLVKLGKKRPKELLPRKVEPPPPPPPKPAPAAEAKPPASKSKSPPPKASTQAKEPAQPKQSFQSALERLKKYGDEEPEGDPEGSPHGEVTSLTEALIGSKYATEIEQCVRANYVIEGIPPERLTNRQATVLVRVKPDGSFFDTRIEKESGLAAFDRAVERAVKRCGKVSPPPEEIRERVTRDGIEFVFKPE